MAQTVLIADDTIASQRLFEMVLKRGGYDVITVGSGSDVVKRVKERRPDVAMIDAVMPETDGYQICQMLKQDPQLKNMPIIMLAGTYEEVDRQKGAKIVGAQAILDKPAKSQDILGKVKELLALQAKAQQAEKKAKETPPATAKAVEQAAPTKKTPVKTAPLPAEVVQEPTFVEEEYEFEENSEEVDLAVESEILDEDADWEEAEDIGDLGDTTETVEEFIEEGVDEPDDEEAAIVASADASVAQRMPERPTTKVPERPAARVIAAPKKVALAEENLDALTTEIAKRVAEKLVPALMQSVTAYVLQFPSVQQIVEQMSKNLAQQILPDVQDALQKK